MAARRPRFGSKVGPSRRRLAASIGVRPSFHVHVSGHVWPVLGARHTPVWASSLCRVSERWRLTSRADMVPNYEQRPRRLGAGDEDHRVGAGVPVPRPASLRTPKPVISHRETPSGDFPRVVRFSRWWSTRREDEPNARRKSAARGRVSPKGRRRVEHQARRVDSGPHAVGGVRSGVVTLRAKLLAGAWDRWGRKIFAQGA